MFSLPATFRPVILLLVLAIGPLGASPVQFSFRVSHDDELNPFVREIWAEVESPVGQTLRLPAYYDGDDIWAVRTRAAEKGNYRFLRAEELMESGLRPISVSLTSDNRFRVRDADELGPPLRIDPRTARTFIDGASRPYVPLGGNLPWADGGTDPVDFYREGMRLFRDTGLNWSRIWMAHWGQLNLDWIEPQHGESPPPGWLDLSVARRWDSLVNFAELAGVRFQMVLQHHGQYSSTVNSDWDLNPWNATNGGWLKQPGEFFTDEQARAVTRDKFRYIAARWGYSSSIMAWELFNEVHWTDARRGDAASNTAVAAWHNEMARHLRRYDVHGHLITTSDDDLSHPLWSSMDYYQPHLYASNMILGVQTLAHPPAVMDRPVFYGEVGDDNMVGLSGEQRADGAAHVPMAWAGMFGITTQPAQLWYIDVLRRNDRWPEMASLAGFAQASGMLSTTFESYSTPAVIGGDTVSWQIEPGYYWERGDNPEINLSSDGLETTELMHFRRILTNASAVPAHPYPSRATFRFRSPAAANAHLRVARVSNQGSALRMTLNDQVVFDQTWPPAAVDRPAPTNIEIPFRLGYGDHVLVIENPTGPEWVDIANLDLGLAVPALVAQARHARDRSILWVRHRNQLLSEAPDEELESTSATVVLEDYPAGSWQITWWDPVAGQSFGATSIDHQGGDLSLITPEVTRHVAAWIQRAE